MVGIVGLAWVVWAEEQLLFPGPPALVSIGLALVSVLGVVWVAWNKQSWWPQRGPALVRVVGLALMSERCRRRFGERAL